MKIRPLEAEYFHAGGKLIVAYRNFCKLARNREQRRTYLKIHKQKRDDNDVDDDDSYCGLLECKILTFCGPSFL